MSGELCAAHVSAVCPRTCGTCSICVDPGKGLTVQHEEGHVGGPPPKKAKKAKKARTRTLKKAKNPEKHDCHWVAQKDTDYRCSVTGNFCRATCGQC